jgi:hypothetical protein
MSRWISSLAALALAACAFDGSGLDADDLGDDILDPNDPDDQPPPPPPDDPPPVIDPGDCAGDALPFAPSNVDRCAIPTPRDNLNLGQGTWVFDTDALTLAVDGRPAAIAATAVAQRGGPELAVVACKRFFVARGGNVQVVGSRPLVLVAFGEIRIEGTVDASATGATAGGGAGSDATCGAGVGSTGGDQRDDFDHAGGAGGAGGGFGTAGGDGPALAGSEGQPASTGGAPGGDASLVPLRGGCRGGNGGNGGGVGGAGGGAIQLVAQAQLRVNGTVSVAGGGGAGGTATSSGGGGGGSGGAILLEARSLEIRGALTANGGGGGEGRLNLGSNGDPGADGDRELADPAGGGNGGTFQFGGNGGSGAAAAIAAAAGATGSRSFAEAAGSGGGGGGVGRVRLNGDVLVGGGAIVSPVAQ